MNIAHVRYFIAAAERGSYTAAAAACYVTVQTVSKAVATLERETGGSLFLRTATGVELTEFGRAFHEKALRAEKLFGELEHAGDTQRETADPQTLVVAVAHTLYRGSIVEADDLQPFARRHPHIDLVILRSSSADCVRAMETGRVDAAVVTGRVDAPMLKADELARVEPALLMDARHPLAARERVVVEDLRDVPVATPPGLAGDYLPLLHACRDRGFAPRFADVMPTLPAHRAFVSDALGVVIVVDSAWVRKAYPGCVVRPFISYPGDAAILSFVYDPARSTPALRAFERFVALVAREAGRADPRHG